MRREIEMAHRTQHIINLAPGEQVFALRNPVLDQLFFALRPAVGAMWLHIAIANVDHSNLF